MIVNTTKSKVMLICSQQKRAYLPSNSLNVTVCGETLECVTSQKVLGLIIDQNVTWKPHIDNLCSEIFKLIGLLWHNKSLLPFACKQLFYNSYIQPKIEYCLPLWGNASKAQLDKLWRLQKKAVRIIHNAPFDAPVMICFANLTVSIYTNVIFIKYVFAYLLYSIHHVHLLVTFLLYTSQIPHMHYGQIMIIYALKCHFHIKKCTNPPFLTHVLFCGISCQLNYAQIILLFRLKKMVKIIFY